MKVGILVSGGDAPGMNYVVYEIHEKLKKLGVELLGIKYGYKGLMENDVIALDQALLEENKLFAGCILKSSRAPEFKTEKGVKKGLKTIEKNSLDALIILGGDGSLKGALELAEKGAKVVFIPATVDNDLKCSSYSLGYYTAVEACRKYIELVMRTMETLDRSCLFEVMGNESGEIAKGAFTVSNADYVINEYNPLNLDKLVKDIKKNKKPCLKIVVQEKLVNLEELSDALTSKTKREFKACVVGYLQRGENPTKEEIKKAKAFSALAVECIRTHTYNKAVVYNEESVEAKSMNEIL